MVEHNIGSINGRHLCLRWYADFVFQRWDHEEWRVYWPAIFNPVLWSRAIFDRDNWVCSCVYQRHCTHRCYCDSGTRCDGCIVVAGFGISWFYSNYTGEIPCPCDKVLSGVDEDEAAGST